MPVPRALGLSAVLLVSTCGVPDLGPQPVPRGPESIAAARAIAVSTSLVLTLWGGAQRTANNELANVVRPEETMTTLQRMGMGTEQARQMVGALVNGEATTLAVNYTFLISGLVLLFAAGVVWLAPRPKLGGAGGPPGH